MYIPDEVINSITVTVEKWKVDIAVGGKTLVKIKIQNDTFQADLVSLLPLMIAMMPFCYRLTKCSMGYKFTKSQDDVKIFVEK